jgi:hypothetical protein
MSNPLTRRMAQAALVLAAGAAPVVGAAGQAHAQALGDEAVNGALDRVTQTAEDVANGVGADVTKAAMPVLAPLVHQVAEDTAHTTGTLLHDAGHTLAERGPNPEQLDEVLPQIAPVNTDGFSLL